MQRYAILLLYIVLLLPGEVYGTDKVLIFAQAGDAQGLDPAREFDSESFNVIDSIFETLVVFVPGTTNLRPGIAESWSISDSRLIYTFNIRKGVYFHDGTRVDAAAVVFSFERQFITTHPYYQYGPWRYWTAMNMDKLIDRIEAVDRYTVRFYLKQPEAPFILNLAMHFASIVSPAGVRKHAGSFGRHPVGTGPFVLEAWRKDDAIILTKNENYWGTSPHLDRVIIKPIPNQTARFFALLRDEVDIIDSPSAENFDAARTNSALQLIQQEGLNISYMAMNTRTPPFDNILVRKAIAHAINKKDIVTGVYGDTAIAAKNLLPPSMSAYNDDIKDYPFDVETARALLAKAGYPNGFKITLWATPVSRAYNPSARRMAEIIQAQLAKANIDARIVSYEWGIFLDKAVKGEHDMILLGWTGDNGDPDNFFNILLSSQSVGRAAGNYTFWSNDEYDSLIMQAKRISTPQKRDELYRQAQVIIHNDVPMIPIAHSIVSVLANRRVKDFLLYPTRVKEFHRVWIDKK